MLSVWQASDMITLWILLGLISKLISHLHTWDEKENNKYIIVYVAHALLLIAVGPLAFIITTHHILFHKEI